MKKPKWFIFMKTEGSLTSRNSYVLSSCYSIIQGDAHRISLYYAIIWNRPHKAISYSYDRATMTRNGSLTEYTYDDNNRLLTEAKTESAADIVTNYTYDANGNQLGKLVDVFTDADARPETLELIEGLAGSEINLYNGFNQLVRVRNEKGTFFYGYNADGLRVTNAEAAGAVTGFVWDGSNIALELQAPLSRAAISEASTSSPRCLPLSHPTTISSTVMVMSSRSPTPADMYPWIMTTTPSVWRRTRTRTTPTLGGIAGSSST